VIPIGSSPSTEIRGPQDCDYSSFFQLFLCPHCSILAAHLPLPKPFDGSINFHIFTIYPLLSLKKSPHYPGIHFVPIAYVALLPSRNFHLSMISNPGFPSSLADNTSRVPDTAPRSPLEQDLPQFSFLLISLNRSLFVQVGLDELQSFPPIKPLSTHGKTGVPHEKSETLSVPYEPPKTQLLFYINSSSPFPPTVSVYRLFPPSFVRPPPLVPIPFPCLQPTVSSPPLTLSFAVKYSQIASFQTLGQIYFPLLVTPHSLRFLFLMLSLPFLTCWTPFLILFAKLFDIPECVPTPPSGQVKVP